MKKKYLILALVLAVMVALTGCSSKITLPKALDNNAKINSCSYELLITGNSNSSLLTEDLGLTDDLIVEFSAEGKMLKDNDRVKIYSDLSASVGGLSLGTPFYIDASEKEFDFDMFIGIPGILKDYFDEGKDNIYLSAADIKNYMKDSLSAEDYQKFEDSLNSSYEDNSLSKKLSDDLSKTFFGYVEKDKLVFTKLDNLKTSANGVYTITLNYEDLKAIVTNFLSNEKYYQDLKMLVESTGELPSDFPDAKTMIKSFNDETTDAQNTTIVVTFTIRNKFVTETNIAFSNTNEDNATTSMTVKLTLTGINEPVEITMPDKTAPSTLKSSDYLDTLGL